MRPRGSTGIGYRQRRDAYLSFILQGSHVQLEDFVSVLFIAGLGVL